MSELSPPPRKRRLKRALLGTLAAGVVCLLGIEGFFRYALFRDDALARKLATAVSGVRRPQSYAHPESPEYWKLHYRVAGRGRGREAHYDPLLGWINEAVEPVTYVHAAETEREGRRPVLLFGDSFAECVTPADECWQGLLARSELGATHHMLNYGTRGFGMGQIALLCKAVAPLYAQERPLVVVSLLVDQDLDRAVVDFRSWPKLVHHLDANGDLQFDQRVLPTTRDAYVESEGIGITSYAWRYLVFGTRLLPGRRAKILAAHDRRVLALNRALLEDLVGALEAQELDYFFLVFHNRGFLSKVPPNQDREDFLLGELERLGAPYVLSRTALVRDARATGRTDTDYYYGVGFGKNHYTPLGNELVFETLRAGIEGRYDTR